MIGNEDIEFARSSQRYIGVYSTGLLWGNVACVVKIFINFASIALFFFLLDQLTATASNYPVFS